ncbi:hypothetical protein DCAR_0830914 [Daucus carota subsp. sativus]|uniref:beta-glucosidase n=1 Tax=Daucus carota subsp. sativus TaxID=79200 RepID=A0AAF0XNS7_DAUCS|nr:hypothetical protein DCAR_0830914 [Daucus carota subsp. sativus]
MQKVGIIPMIYYIDAVYGNNNVYGATIFPHNVGLGATRDPILVKKIGAATALELCRDPRWGRRYESYSEYHKIVQAMTEIIPGSQGDILNNSRKGVPFLAGHMPLLLHNNDVYYFCNHIYLSQLPHCLFFVHVWSNRRKVAACAKHFVGDGETNKGVHENNTIISSLGLFSIHMPAYYNSIIKGVATVMIAYSSWNGDASLVRIMKSRKVLGQHQLLTECVEQINHMFKVLKIVSMIFAQFVTVSVLDNCLCNLI